MHRSAWRNCLINRKRTRERLRLTPPKATKRHLWLRSDLSWESTVRPFWNYQTVSGETVWKIAEGVSPRLSGGKRRPNRDSFDPSWLLSEPRFGTYPEFPNSFIR